MMGERATHESMAMLRMWRAVAAGAITDAAREISRADDESRERALDHSRRYFNGRDWREICETAQITHNPEAVMRFLRSDRAKATPRECMVEMGAIERSTACRQAREAAE